MDEILSTTKQINQKTFVIAVIYLEKEICIMHVAYLKSKMTIHLVWKVKIALLPAKKVMVSTKYSNFADIFFSKISNNTIQVF